MSALEALVRSVARQTRVNGALSLTSNGNAALMAAFAELGWCDPYPIETSDAIEGPIEAAVIEAPEYAVEERPEGHVV